ncbi:uncharacterized protein M6B38_158745 [Iris pallida]|uniref:Uncharacterized protein n=1 Tax=Iris pallida TaxID=29817 RepID=A0AAX6F2T6_IRIPA|nr:uncharacterized protein M6B38_158745 [Iris pallida]
MGQMLTFFQQMLETQRAQAEAQQRQTDAMHQGMEDAISWPLQPWSRGLLIRGRDRVRDIQDFKKLGPRDFSGTEGVVYADDWLEDIERQMRASRLADDLKVEGSRFAVARHCTHLVQKRASPSWRGPYLGRVQALFKEKFFSPGQD